MHTAERVTLARLPSGVKIETTVHTYGDPDSDGPTLYVQAAQHGREVNGTEVLRRLHEQLIANETKLHGTLIAVPVADPLTFDRVSYTTPEILDSVNDNMNRCWPGDADGSLHERMAATLWSYASSADAIVDLHTGSPTMLTHTVYMDGNDESKRLAEAFGTDLLLAEAAGDSASTEWSERNFGGKFRVAATREGIPSITPELAHSKQLVEPAIDAGVTGMFNVLAAYDLREQPVPEWDGTRARNHLGRVRATDAGLFVPRTDITLGQDVSEGDSFGTVYDPTTYEALQTVTADRDGILYSIAREATVTGGSTLIGVAERIA
ncbi:succinylglutamate desuccinylase/aspartoacylase family protein [Natronocalculus amylovorans]|uniref:Succinylglutamate desuccinylase/aspartoacylase family protein n=1 Tax=Natronocalculus amylovorans TaxID=2917812 RepID=A0AAE3K7X8_9EURY|nr:succinylglutamate desuccinylase/aspartoacylase family protein [Natronocalculus amylovorans]MCL9816446.1 succinylglutamate desuccinylase/aspartoacylase family protein [Natronocalculus amylovorans]NUE00893.1 succinylglutamate desuccinylase/aspartoacylase family protein [Halorubraceae archaeon YAN]